MIVYIAQVLLDNNTLGRQFTMITGVDGRIEGHIIVRHDTTTTIDRTMLSERLILQRISEMDTVDIGQLATLQTIHHIHRIVFASTLGIRFLDTTTRGRIVMCDGQADHRTIRQINRSLHQSFSECATAYHQTAILILNGTRHNLCS